VIKNMKPEYIEGQKALKNFEDGMRTIFKASKPVKRGKKRATSSPSLRKPKNGDKD
jgi:hypothetical protein